MRIKINFASDNYSGTHSSVLEWLSKVNQGPAPAYGSDLYTQEATHIFKKQFGSAAEVYFVWNGTAANVLGIQAAVKSHHSILCSHLAHIHADECGAPEKFTGAKLALLPEENGKITPSMILESLGRRGDQHAPQPKLISISQATEYGTVYSLEEMKALSTVAKKQNLYLHVDGARIANAAASLGCSFKDLITEAGVDILSFGGTKNGLMGAEAVVILNGELQKDFQFIRKQGLHLSSKMRFVAAQFLAYFEKDLWKKNALHSNQMAKSLAEQVNALCPSIQITRPVQANSIFMILDPKVTQKLQEQFSFYVWNEKTGECRIMCSFQTTPNEVEAFTQALKTCLN